MSGKTDLCQGKTKVPGVCTRNVPDDLFLTPIEEMHNFDCVSVVMNTSIRLWKILTC